jgi:uncharacterized membrane protein YccC
MHGLSLAAIGRDLLYVDRSQINWRVAVRIALGVALPLVIGEASGHFGAGLAVTIGALNVAFTDPPGLDQTKIERMSIASLVGAASVFFGSTTGEIHWLHLLLLVFWGLR